MCSASPAAAWRRSRFTPDLHSVQPLDPIQGLLKAFAAGEITTYQHVVVRGR